MRDDDAPTQLPTRLEITRRDALKLFGAGVALLQAGCQERTGEEIRPAVRIPEHAPGTPRMFATSMVVDGYATGLLALAYDGRPTKIEGNPAHPASRGATLPAHQASILDLYDPHRLRAPQHGGMPTTWDQLRDKIAKGVEDELWLILPPDGSPSIARQLDAVRARFPTLHVVYHAAMPRAEAHRGTQLAFGAPLELQLALDRADVLVALDADVLSAMPMSVRWARDFARRRRAVEPGEEPMRVFVAEPMLTPTGSMADHRLAVRASDIAAVAVALAGALGRLGVAGVDVPDALVQQARARVDAAWIDRTAQALVRRPRASALVVGDRQPAAVHALVHRLTLALGNVGTTTSFTKPVIEAGGETLVDLVAAIRGHRVGAVLAIETDPIHDAPAELGLDGLLSGVPLTLHAGMYETETSAASQWVMPLSHYLECWGDARAWDGTLSLVQPLIKPLHDSRSRLQILAMLAGTEAPDDRALVRAGFSSESAWHAALSEGVIAGSAAPVVSVQPRGDGDLAGELAKLLAPAGPIEIDIAPSPTIGDGRFANNPWLQELPHPITKLTWGNAAQMSAATARSLGVADGEVLAITHGITTIHAPALVAVGHADGCVTLELGYGQTSPSAPISNGVGVNAARLALGGPIVREAAFARTPRRISLARTQDHQHRHDRDTAFLLELASYRGRPEQLDEYRGEQPTLLDSPRLPTELLQWAMTIDTTICTGCSSCMVACQAENNVPVVGEAGVRRGREMHWIRIDTYVEDNTVVHQPMLCQHCENAPCEYVCPVFATTHSPDGLNEMTYNRCVGTRFCSNNCPYKVRRFNWFAYDKPVTTAALQRNPNVTVRERGVMEKCTYCVQRIRGAQQRSMIEQRHLAPGEVMTACQQACPTGAIQFGALQHTGTEMVEWRKSQRLYGALHDLGTRPRTMYLAKVRDGGDE